MTSTVTGPERTLAVIGGGILGMELASQFRAAGRAVTLYEAAPYLGGLADAWQLGDITWDRHYHVTLMSDTRLRALLERLGLADELIWGETKTGFYTDGRLYSMSNTVEFLKFPPLGLLDKLRLGGTIFYASKVKDWRRLERIPVVDWLTSLSGRRTTEKMWLPLLRAKLGDNYKYASAAFIWAIIARMYAARRTGLKKEMFGYVSGGYANILGRFTDQLVEDGVTVRTACPVEAVRKADGRLVVEPVDGDPEAFDDVIVTAAAPLAAKLCPDLLPAETDRLRSLRYQGIVCVSLLLRKPLAHYYVTNITDPDIPFTAVIETTALVDPATFGGRHLVYLPKYVDPTDPLFDEPDQSIRERFLTALARMYPHFDHALVEAVRVSRVRNVLAISTLDYSAELPPMRTSVSGLFVVNTSQIANGTLNVNETLQLADRAVAELTTAVSA
jgi:protoporphyrinogen oxidase